MEAAMQEFLPYSSPFVTAPLTVISSTPVYGWRPLSSPTEDLFFPLSEVPLLSEFSLLADSFLASVLNTLVFPEALISP